VLLTIGPADSQEKSRRSLLIAALAEQGIAIETTEHYDAVALLKD
jgi:hypothetical protein